MRTVFPAQHNLRNLMIDSTDFPLHLYDVLYKHYFDHFVLNHIIYLFLSYGILVRPSINLSCVMLYDGVIRERILNWSRCDKQQSGHV